PSGPCRSWRSLACSRTSFLGPTWSKVTLGLDHFLGRTSSRWAVSSPMDTTRLPHRSNRWPLAIGVMILAPPCAECSIGYADNPRDPLALVGGALILSPLYGAATMSSGRAVGRTTRRARRCGLYFEPVAPVPHSDPRHQGVHGRPEHLRVIHHLHVS